MTGEKGLEAAIPVGSNIANEYMVRAIIEAYDAARSAEPEGWDLVSDGAADRAPARHLPDCAQSHGCGRVTRLHPLRHRPTGGRA